MRGVTPLQSFAAPQPDSAETPAAQTKGSSTRATILISDAAHCSAAEQDTGAAALAFQRGGRARQVMRRCGAGCIPRRPSSICTASRKPRPAIDSPILSREREMGRRSVTIVHGKAIVPARGVRSSKAR